MRPELRIDRETCHSSSTSASAAPLRPARGFARRHPPKEPSMNITLSLGPLVALIAGILILVMPRLLNYIVALYLIIIGVIGLIGPAGTHL
jgi:hypothetical protein